MLICKKIFAAMTCAALAISVNCHVLAATIEQTGSLVTDNALSSVSYVSMTTAGRGVLYSTKDLEGNSFGPADYVVEGNNVYMLNTATNAIYEYHNDQLLNEISLDEAGVFGIMLSANDKEVYVLSNQLSIEKVTGDGVSNVGNLASVLEMDSVFDFQVKDQHIYVSEPTANGNVTYMLEMNTETEKWEKVKTIAGYMVDETTFYQSELVSDDGRLFGHRCNISVMDQNGNEIDFITLYSDNYIIGAQYLGTNIAGDHIVKQIEMSTVDGLMEETIRTINSENEVVNCSHVSEPVDSMLMRIKVIDGTVYQFEMNQKAGAVKSIATEHLPQVETFVSELSPDVTTYEEEISLGPVTAGLNAVASTISRKNVLQIAEDYCFSFYWTCTDNNLAAMTNWTCPRYVTGADTYGSMPYCWGGFHTVSQFINGLNNGGRVGNIYTGTGSYVSNTYGLDCSGFVSKCWGQTTKYGTSTLSQISSTLSNHSYLQLGDALNKAGSHVMLFYGTDGSGNYQLYESTTYNQYDRVAFTLRSATSVSDYTAIRYNGIVD